MSEAEKERITKTIATIPEGIETVLDLGCGDGKITNRISRHYSVWAADISVQELSKVSSDLRVCCSAEYIPFKDASFDLVLATELLEHIPDQQYHTVLKEIQRVAKKYILISIPYKESLLKGLTKCRFCGMIYHISWHQRSYDLESAKSLFPGWKIDKIVGISQRTERELTLLYYILHFIGNKWSQSGYNLCPFCGRHNVNPPRGNFIGLITEKLIFNINKYFPLKKEIFSWIIILFTK